MISKINLIKTALLVIIVLNTSNAFSQKKDQYITLSSFKPEDSNYSDLNKIYPFFDSAETIGVGESTHGTSEFTSMRQRLFQFLVRAHDFNTIMLEADFGACQGINRYVTGVNDSLPKALNEIKLWPWRTDEMISLIKWIRNYNLNHTSAQIEFAGCDMQLPLTDLKELSAQITNEAQKNKLSDFIKTKELIFKNKNSLQELLYEINKENDNNYKVKLICKSVIQNINIDTKLRMLDIANYRDSCMADNVINYKKFRPNRKMLFIAHNTHVSKQFSKIDENHNRKTTGWYLDKKFRNKYFSIGQVFNTGSFNAVSIKNPDKGIENFVIRKSKNKTLGKYLSSFGLEELFVLQKWVPENIQKMKEIGSGYKKGFKMYRNKNVVKNYDAFIFINSTTPTHLRLFSQ